jgi:hypothetical protein
MLGGLAMSERHSLRWLLGWAAQQWALETPNLDHSVALVDPGGSPDMKAAARAYLNLSFRGEGADDWRRVACRLDRDGFYRTPLRCALANIRNDWIRRFLHDLLPNAVLSPSYVAELHGVPRAVETWVMQGCLELLYREYVNRPRVERSWVDLSDSQRSAVVAGEAVA